MRRSPSGPAPPNPSRARAETAVRTSVSPRTSVRPARAFGGTLARAPSGSTARGRSMLEVAPASRSPASSGRVTTSTARVSPHCDRASSAALATWPTARPASAASPPATSQGTTPAGRWRRRRCHGTVARGGRRRVRAAPTLPPDSPIGGAGDEVGERRTARPPGEGPGRAPWRRGRAGRAGWAGGRSPAAREPTVRPAGRKGRRIRSRARPPGRRRGRRRRGGAAGSAAARGSWRRTGRTPRPGSPGADRVPSRPTS